MAGRDMEALAIGYPHIPQDQFPAQTLAAESIRAVYDAGEHARGLKMVYEPKHQPFFQARFERV
jgi:tryptophanase